MQIRLARNEDYAAIARLHRQTIRQVNSKDYSKAQIQAWSARPSAKRLRTSASEFKRWVATADGKVVGYCDHGLDGQFGGIYMHKDYIGRGIGSRLLKTAEDSMKTMGFKKSKLEATITAKEFYKKQGYKVLAKSLHAMGDQLLEVYIMTKELS